MSFNDRLPQGAVGVALATDNLLEQARHGPRTHVAIDFETRSAVDIGSRGAFVYFECPHARVMFGAYRIDGGPIKRWLLGEPCPADLRAAIEAGAIISAHNAAFEALCFDWLVAHCGWPAPLDTQFRCTAATAAALSLPRKLADLGRALGLDVQKDDDGKRLIRLFCIPRRPRKGEDPDAGPYWNDATTHPADWTLFRNYCDTDVAAEEAADERMVPLSAYEQRLYTIDQRINRRGIRIDRRSAVACLTLAEKAKRHLDAEMRKATGGFVQACSQPTKLVEWVQAQNVDLPSAAKAEIEELLECDDLPAPVRRAVELRQEAAKTSVSKLSAFLKRANREGRIQGAFLFCAAGTGRWSSVGAQLHNLPRPRKEFGDAKLDARALFEAFNLGEIEHLKAMYGEKLGRTLWLISDAIRGFLWARPGYELLVADYSGIEGAVAAWLADEDWKVKKFFEILADTTLPDMYRIAAAGIFNTTTDIIDKKDPRRQVGKVSELSLQYQGGVNAFRSMARNYSMKLAPIFAPVWASASEERREKALKRYDACVARGEEITKLLTKEAWLAGELVKIGWRATHPAIVKAWKDLETAIRHAVESPGRETTAAKCTYLMTRGFLWCRLPSGRCLAYASPKLKPQVWVKRTGIDASEVMDKAEAERLAARGEVTIEGQTSAKATALGVNSITKKWERFGLYGGLAFENITQAVARDLLAHGIVKAEDAGYEVIGHVHDEIICEVPRGTADVHAFERLICELPEWAAGLPLTADGWAGKRYRK